MADPLTASAIGGVIITGLKEVGKWIWGYAKKSFFSLWDNKWILIVAGTSSGLFIYYYNMLYKWFGFPPLLNTAILGIFALINLSWVVVNWKQAPSEGGGSGKSPKVSTGK